MFRREYCLIQDCLLLNLPRANLDFCSNSTSNKPEVYSGDSHQSHHQLECTKCSPHWLQSQSEPQRKDWSYERNQPFSRQHICSRVWLDGNFFLCVVGRRCWKQFQIPGSGTSVGVDHYSSRGSGSEAEGESDCSYSVL